MRKPLIAFVLTCLSACAAAPRPDVREISRDPPGSPNAWINLEFPELGIAMTLPNALKWKAEVSAGGSILSITHLRMPLRMEMRVYPLPFFEAVEEAIHRARMRLMTRSAGSGAHVGSVADEYGGRRSFSVTVPGSGSVDRTIKRILAPMPGRPDQTILIEISGPTPIFRRLAAATHFMVESIRRLGVNEAIITVPGS